MSRADIKTIKCKECSNEFGIYVWGSINVTVDPELREKILKEEVNFGFCPKCGAPHKIISPFLYHDMDKKLLVWVRLEEERPQKEEFLKQLKKIAEEEMPMVGKGFGGYIYGVVFGIKELKKKLKQAGEWEKEELKLCTKSRYGREFIATVSIKNNEVVIETEEPKVKEDLLKEINRLVENGGIFVFKHKFQEDDYTLLGALIKPQDPHFLFALKNCSYLWQSNKKYGGHIIYGFCSALIEKEETIAQTIDFLKLGETIKIPTEKKFDVKIYEHPHKDKGYCKHILARVVKTTTGYYSAQKSMTPDQRAKWNEYFFESINQDKGFINDYAKAGPIQDFFESGLAYEEDEEMLKECNIEKYNFIKENYTRPGTQKI
jgi:hypothetical protein